MIFEHFADQLVETHGHRVDSEYVETFWLPSLGPTATLMLRRVGMWVLAGPVVVDDIDGFYRAFGVAGTGNNSPGRRALDRLTRFGAARWAAPDTLQVRSHLDNIRPKAVTLLPDWLATAHHAQLTPAVSV